MDCERLGEQLSALADGELRGMTARRLRRHARGCARCAAELVALQETRAAVRRRAASGERGAVVSSESAPPEFWASVSQRLDAVDAAASPMRQRGRPLRLGWVALLVVLALVGAVAAFVLSRPVRVSPGWVAGWQSRPLAAGLRVEQGEEGELLLSASPSAVAPWMSRRLGRETPPIDLELVGLTLRGGLVWEERGRAIGLLRYARGAERWSLLIIPGRAELEGGQTAAAGRQPFRIATAGGTRMAAWHSRGSLFVLAGATTEEELLRVARQAARACEIGR